MQYSIETGLKTLEPYISAEAVHIWTDFHTYKGQLADNLRRERLFGVNPTVQSERSAIIYNLNIIALELTGISFVDLCLGILPTKPTPQSAPSHPIREALTERIQHVRDMIYENQRRLDQLELQQARQGINTDPAITIEIADLKQKIQKFEEEILALRPSS